MCSKHGYRENKWMHPALYNMLAQKITACTAVIYLFIGEARRDDDDNDNNNDHLVST